MSILRVIQISDCHLQADPDETFRGCNPDRNLRAVIDRLSAEPKDLVVVTGDISQDGSRASYRRFYRHLARLRCPVYCLPGNHDVPATLRRCLSRRPLYRRPFLRFRGWLFCFLDTTIAGQVGGHCSPADLAALADMLARFPDMPTMICLHHPAMPCGSRWLDEGLIVDNPDVLFELLASHRQVKAMIWGHIHQAFSANRAGIRCWATPSTAMQFASASDEFALADERPGYRRLLLAGDGRIDSELIRVDLTAGHAGSE